MPQSIEERRAYMREYQRAWRARNPEKARASQRKSKEKHRAKYNERKRAWRAANQEKAHEQDRAQRAKDPGRNQHGRWIGEDRAAMWQAQGGLCYLCSEPLDDARRIRVDHDHDHCPANTSCRICRRGLVHHRCNIAIGMADDDPARLRRMADALEKAQAEFQQRVAAAERQEELF